MTFYILLVSLKNIFRYGFNTFANTTSANLGLYLLFSDVW